MSTPHGTGGARELMIGGSILLVMAGLACQLTHAMEESALHAWNEVTKNEPILEETTTVAGLRALHTSPMLQSWIGRKLMATSGCSRRQVRTWMTLGGMYEGKYPYFDFHISMDGCWRWCEVSNVRVYCKDFPFTVTEDPKWDISSFTFRRISRDTCLLKDGRQIPYPGGVVFRYHVTAPNYPSTPPVVYTMDLDVINC